MQATTTSAQSVSPGDALAVLHLRSYPPDVGAADLDAATAEIDATFAGDYGALRLDAYSAAHGHGVATALVTAAVEACRATGDSTLSLRVGTGTSAAAHAIYATLGFVDPEQ